MTDFHPDLDAYLDGDLSDADVRSVETHIEACAACADDLAIARQLSAAFASMRDGTCPPDLVAEAIAAAQRRAPDRSLARSSVSRFARLNRWAIACVVLVIGAVGLSRLVADRQPDAVPASGSDALAEDALAEARPDPTPATPPPPVRAAPPPDIDPPPAESVTEVTPRRASPSPPARRETRPRPHTPTPTPPQSIDLAPDPALPASAAEDAEVQQAQADLLLALSLVADAQSHARSNVSHQLERAADALHDTPIY